MWGTKPRNRTGAPGAASSALCREAVDAGTAASGAKIKPGEPSEALHRERLSATRRARLSATLHPARLELPTPVSRLDARPLRRPTYREPRYHRGGWASSAFAVTTEMAVFAHLLVAIHG